MPKPKNDPIGTCPCPIKGCGETAHVFKFRPRGNEKQSRLAGKLYMHCKACGRSGADGSAAIQDYILDNKETVLWDESEKAAQAQRPKKPAPGPAPTSAPAPKPAPAPAPANRPDLWDM